MTVDCVSGARPEAGEEINGYRVVQFIKPGAFAFSAKALHLATKRTVFFKKYKSPGGRDAWFDAFVAYQNELKRRIQSHPAAKGMCYELLEFFERRKQGAPKVKAFYQVFEWVENGFDLDQMLLKLGKQSLTSSWSQRVAFARVMVAGVRAIHDAGVIHGDLKPKNLYLIPDDRLPIKFKLRVIDLDFSLLDGVKAPWIGSDRGPLSGFVGTPGYQSPEHLRGQLPHRASDVFTCALMLGELLGEQHPAGEDRGSYGERAVNGLLAPVKLRNEIELVKDRVFLECVINQALSPKPENRPTAGELLDALNGRLLEFRNCTQKPVVDGLRPSIVRLLGPNGKAIEIRISSTLGKGLFKDWGDEFSKFMSKEQFRIHRSDTGQWTLEHCQSAHNATTVDGMPVTTSVALKDGAVIALGKSGKCALRVKFQKLPSTEPT